MTDVDIVVPVYNEEAALDASVRRLHEYLGAHGLRIHEVPVDWVDDADSRVDVRTTAVDDLRGLWRVLRRFAAGEGVVSDGSFPRRGRLRKAG